MTTPASERLYRARHLAEVEGRGWAAFNPRDKPLEKLPIIYGFNNGGDPATFLSACLLAEDGTGLGSHACSHECYMPHDLGVLDGSRPDRHETFRGHYPDGYRMVFVGYEDAGTHEGLQAAFKRAPAPEEGSPDESLVQLPCLNCGKMHKFALDSNEANGVFNVFCKGECEDRYAAKQ